MEDSLHALVHSLDRSEVKFLRSFVPPGLTRRPKPVMDLFEVLLKQKTYDKVALQKRFSKDLRKPRSSLRDYLLKCMRLKRDSENEKAQVAAHLSDYEFLYEKGFYEASLKALMKAKKLAKEYQFNGLLIDIINLEKHRLIEMRKQNLVEMIIEKNLEITELLLRYQGEAEAASEYHEVLSLFRKGGKSIREIGAIVAGNAMESTIHTADTFFTKLYRYSTCVIAAKVGANYERASQGLATIIQHWNSHAKIKALHITQYRNSLYNYTAQCIEAGYIPEAARMIQEFEALPSNNFNQEAEKFQSLAYLKVMYAMLVEDKADVDQLSDMVTKGLLTYQEKVNKSREFTIKDNLMKLLIIDESFSDAMFWAESIIAEKKYPIRREIINNARLVLLIIHWELGMVDKLSNEIPAFYQYLYTNGYLNPFSKTLISYLKKLINAVNEKEVSMIFQSMKDALHGIEESKKNEPPEQALILCWLGHKVSGKPIREIVFEKISSSVKDGHPGLLDSAAIPSLGN